MTKQAWQADIKTMPRSKGGDFVVGDTPTVDISERQARYQKYQITVAKLPRAKELDEFDFADTCTVRLALRPVSLPPCKDSANDRKANPVLNRWSGRF